MIRWRVRAVSVVLAGLRFLDRSSVGVCRVEWRNSYGVRRDT